MAQLIIENDKIKEQLFTNFNIFATKDKKKYEENYDNIKKIINNLNPWLTLYVANILLDILNSSERAQRQYVYKTLNYLTKTNNKQITPLLSNLIPVVTNDVNSSQKEVKESSMKCLKQLLKCSNNADLEPFIPVILEAFTNPGSINTSVEKLASCIFVQNVEAPALAIVTPILVKGLNDRKTETKRKCCVIIDNMCKLVEHPKEISAFGEMLKKLIEKNSETISDPEAREVANKALNTIKSCLGNYNEAQNNSLTIDNIQKYFKENYPSYEYKESLNYIIQNLGFIQEFDPEIWYNNFKFYIMNKTDEEISTICNEMRKYIEKIFEVKEDIYEDNEEGVDLYKGSFSLAYGALTLLNNCNLHLKRNRFYGLLGPNNCGKTTLMRAIANEQVEGFPKKDELKTIFVEHEIQEREVGEDDKGFPILNIDLCGIDWILDYCNVLCEMNPKVTSEQVETLMMDIGFGNSRQDFGKDRLADANMGVTTYSGGWKVKMQLCQNFNERRYIDA